MKSRSLSSALLLATLAAGGATGAADEPTLGGQIKPLLKQYCVDCHNPEKQKGDLDLVPFLDDAKMKEHRDVWEKIAELVESREMPPKKKPQPSDEQRDLVLGFIDNQFAKLDAAAEKNPGRVTIRRLNKEEYRNTIRDLLGVDFNPEDFPNDEVGYGFDNIADVLSLSPMLMEKFLAAADEIVHKAIVPDVVAKPFTKRLKGDAFHSPND